MKAHLKVIKGPARGSAFAFSSEGRTVVGRDSSQAQISLDDRGLSSAHFLIEFEDGVWILRDLASEGGTFVNDQEIVEVEIRSGDRIHAGECEFSFSSEERASQPIAEAELSLPQAPELQASDLAGERLGDFEILEKITESERTVLYKARWHSKDRTVAVKVVKPEVALDEVALARFVRGAHVGSRFGHPNACKMYGAGHAAGLHYIVMEYLSGSSVAALMETRGIAGMFDPLGALDAAIAVAAAIAAAHERGIVHRDIKPSHIMITDEKRVKVVGLGVAKSLVPSTVSPNVTVQDSLVGTLNYMAPEATVDATDVDERSDIYSLGACLFAMVTGKTPFESLRRAETIQRIRREELPSPKKFNMSVPDDLCAVIAKATRRIPSERYPTMAAMLEALESAKKRLRR
ncbi:MAG: FHA domain-containing serine/threonine-protein kinase [Planctomycetota bacterium]